MVNLPARKEKKEDSGELLSHCPGNPNKPASSGKKRGKGSTELGRKRTLLPRKKSHDS